VIKTLFSAPNWTLV